MDDKRTKAAIESTIALLARRVSAANGEIGGFKPTELPGWETACTVLALHLRQAADCIQTLVDYDAKIAETTSEVEHWKKEAALYGANHNRMMDAAKDKEMEDGE